MNRWRTGSFGGTIAVVAGIALILDQVTKVVARVSLTTCTGLPQSACDRIHLVGPAELVRVDNGGSALGFGQGLLVWTLLAAAGLVVVAALPRYGRATASMALGTGLLLGGPAANLADRLVFGRVTDFIGLAWGPGTGIVLNAVRRPARRGHPRHSGTPPSPVLAGETGVSSCRSPKKLALEGGR
jgi:lipoprotein signal peptidase